MKNYTKVYINGDWVTPHGTGTQDIINPFTEEVALSVPKCDLVDVDNAVAAAKEAFKAWSQTSAQYRSDLINAVVAKMEERKEDLCHAAHITMGCPAHLSGVIHVDGPIHGMSTYAKRAFLMEEEEKKCFAAAMRFGRVDFEKLRLSIPEFSIRSFKSCSLNSCQTFIA